MSTLFTLKTFSIVGWICFGGEVLFVIMLFAGRNIGDDAAGRGLGTAYGAILAPVVLLAGGILLWGTLSHSRPLTFTGALLTSLPLLVMVGATASGMVNKASRAAWGSRQGKFSDPSLTRIARAIDRGDTVTVKALLGVARPLDFSVRDPWERTLLGHAVHRATAMYAKGNRKELVRVLLENGVPYAADAEKPGGDWARDVACNATDNDNDLLEVALMHGADPNANEAYDDHPQIFSSNMTVAKVALLVKHGADLERRSSRVDRKEWSVLMNAVYLQQWDLALYFLEHGVSPGYKAPDGQDVRTLLDEVRKGSRLGSSGDITMEQFELALNATPRAAR